MSHPSRKLNISILKIPGHGAARRLTPKLLPSVLLALSPVSVCAQDNAMMIEEVIVTAQKRAQSMQSVPIAVTALSEEAMREANIFDVAGIAARTPGFSMGSFNAGQPQLFIRGIGSNDDGAGADSSVVTFIDEVYISRSAGTVFDLFDLERVEVLRGPQGTLYGKNAVGGAVNLVTTKPDENFYGRAEATVGNLDAVVLRGLVSGPLADNVFGKVSFSKRQRDGYVESIVIDEDLSEQDRWGVRGALRFVPNEDLDIQLMGDYNKSDENGNGRTLRPEGDLYDAGLAVDPRGIKDYDKTYADEAGQQDTEIWGVSARVDWLIAGGTFTSITAYRESEYDMVDDIGNWSLSIADIIDATTYVDESADQTSQEFRFAGTSFNDSLTWVLGMYYLKENTDRQEDTQVFVAATAGTPLGISYSFQDNTTESYSVFGDFTYNITDALSITAGVRYTDEEKDIRQVGIAPIAVGHTINEDYDVSAKQSWDATTPRVVLNYQLNDDIFLYASASEGFKSGGFAGTAPNALAAGTPYDQEDATAYEIGAKTEWLDNRLRLNIAVFSTDYTDLQVLQRVPAFPGDPLGIVITENAADATSEGVELEFTALLFEGFELSGNYAYLDATYDEYLQPNGVDNAGNDLRNAPENAYNIVARYAMDLQSGAELGIRYEYDHQDESFQDPENIKGARKPEYDLQHLRVWYQPASRRWEVAAWVENLADEEYLTHNFPLPPFGNPGTVGTPRTYGVTGTYNFGN